MLSYFPIYNLLKFYYESKHSADNPRFCYSFWLRLLKYLQPYKHNLSRVAEIGTGHTTGVGLMALLTGTEVFCAFEVNKKKYNGIRNIQIFEAMVQLLKARTPIPDEKEFPQINIIIDDYSFPSDILTDAILDFTLNKYRLASLIRDLKLGNTSGSFHYYNNWNKKKNTFKYFDFVYSRAVMEHVDYPESIHKDISDLLKTDGLLLHDIEFHSHGISNLWNGHYFYSPKVWRLIKGKRKNFLNRLTLNEHLEIIKYTNSEILDILKRYKEPGNINHEFFNKYTLEDLKIIGACVLLKKSEFSNINLNLNV